MILFTAQLKFHNHLKSNEDDLKLPLQQSYSSAVKSCVFASLALQ
jgi:hypothetical protein